MNLKSPRFWINSAVLASLVVGFASVGLSANQARYNVSNGIRPLGMATGSGEEGEYEVAIDTSVDPYGISAAIVETSEAPVSLDVPLTKLSQAGQTEKFLRDEPAAPVEILIDGSSPSGIDPVAQNGRIRSSMPTPGITFAGLDLQNYGGGWPPDTHGAVGPSHYIQAVNTSMAIYDKATGARLVALTMNNFFPAGNACDTNNQGDPVVLYDHVSGRYIVTDFNWASTNGPFYECIAVSKTTDPVNGGWWSYALQVGSTDMGDYPKLGIWHDGIYMGANMFRRARTYAGAKVWALNRSDLISGAPLRTISFNIGTSYFSIFPSNAGIASAMPAAGTPNYFFSNYGVSTSVRMWKFTANWTTPAASTFTGPTTISTASYTKPSARVPQKSSTETLDTLGDRVMSNPEFVNIGGTPAVWVNFTVSSGGVTGVRWMEIRNPNTATSVYQQGTFQPDTTYRWMPSLAVDKQGNLAIGYSASSSAMFPAIRYAGRLATDSLGLLAQGEGTLFAGTGSQNGGYNRWGDYATMTVDPNDGCTFWFSTEYYATTGNNWQTRVGSFKYPGCN